MDAEQKRLFLAVVLSAIVLFGWQVFFAPKILTTQDITVQENHPFPDNQPQSSRGGRPVENVKKNGSLTTKLNLQNIILENFDSSLHLSSDLTIYDYKTNNARFPFFDIIGSNRAFEIYVINTENLLEKINFIVEQHSSKDLLIAKNKKYGIRLTVKLENNGRSLLTLTSSIPLRYRIQFNSAPAKLDNGQARQFITFSQDVETYSLDEEMRLEEPFRWFGVDFNYHIFAIVFDEKRPLVLEIVREGLLIADLSRPMNSLEFSLVFTRKDYDLLESYGNSLHMAVDFGVFGILGVPILRILQWFYYYIPNYGVGIILLTLLLRIITFPLQYKSFKSMKKMQKITPDLQKLREKFKDNPQRMQQETMALFKRAGANPLGGCVPLLLQMPILFAFYQVLYNAVELVGAPFVGWITDLSVKDPFYVFPVLCTISMFLHQKLTPMATTDPTQRKILLFMPFFFGLIMKDLPSGLVLYIVVSTLLGIIQQLLVYKMAD